ncbi:MAG: PLP-dependent cysteine synthase family protein, partial [Lysobacter sp.]
MGANFTVSPDAQARRAESSRSWVRNAVRVLQREAARSADTHLLHVSMPTYLGIDFYFKDESSHPSGSLKHRLA